MAQKRSARKQEENSSAVPLVILPPEMISGDVDPTDANQLSITLPRGLWKKLAMDTAELAGYEEQAGQMAAAVVSNAIVKHLVAAIG